jgi:hypothetical protein
MDKKPNSAKAQRSRILDWLKRYESVTTIECQEILDIMRPAPRIFELRLRGHDIHTQPVRAETLQGCWHNRVARYILIKLAEDNS